MISRIIDIFVAMMTTFIATFFLFISQLSNNQQVRVIHIKPLGHMDNSEVMFIKTSIEEFYHFKCIIDTVEPLTNDLLSKSGTRYDAPSILKKYKTPKNILLITSKDITHKDTKRKIEEYGIIGLGLLHGTVCVVSTYRIKKNVSDIKFHDRLKKVSLHEVGHNLGLNHCDNNIHCLMNDAKGTSKQIDIEKVWLCQKCVRILK